MRRLILTPRWILWHLLTLGAMVTCGFLSAWQWHRAGEAMGSALNVGYGLQWPLFAVFFGVMWWRLLHMEAVKLEEAPAADEAVEATSAEPASRPAPVAEPVPAPRPAGPAATPSPFGPRPTGLDTTLDDDDPDDRRLAAYNRMLAGLAATEES